MKTHLIRLASLLSTRLRTNYLKTVSPSLSKRTYLFLQQSVGFGDWLVLVMMAIHLDIKLFSEILEEIGNWGRGFVFFYDPSLFRVCGEIRGTKPRGESQHGGGHRRDRGDGEEGQVKAIAQQGLPQQ